MLPPVPEGHIRLYRVDGRVPNVPGISGRWFSDDPAYVKWYDKSGLQWSYVDVPKEVAEESRYDLLKNEYHLYGVEKKDFFLPQGWADARKAIDGPPPGSDQPVELPELTEVTSNMAVPGKILLFSKETGEVVVVKSSTPTHAVVIRKNRRTGSYRESVLPIRKVD